MQPWLSRDRGVASFRIFGNWAGGRAGGRAAVGAGKGVTPRSGKRGRAGKSNLSEGFELSGTAASVSKRKVGEGAD